MVLKGGSWVNPETFTTIIPELQNRSVISVVGGYNHFCALTSSGKLLTWGEYSKGALGLGDPSKLPIGSPGGFAEENHRVQPHVHRPPPEVMVPSEVRFDHGLEATERVEECCVAVIASRYHTAAIVI